MLGAGAAAGVPGIGRETEVCAEPGQCKHEYRELQLLHTARTWVGERQAHRQAQGSDGVSVIRSCDGTAPLRWACVCPCCDAHRHPLVSTRCRGSSETSFMTYLQGNNQAAGATQEGGAVMPLDYAGNKLPANGGRSIAPSSILSEDCAMHSHRTVSTCAAVFPPLQRSRPVKLSVI